MPDATLPEVVAASRLLAVAPGPGAALEVGPSALALGGVLVVITETTDEVGAVGVLRAPAAAARRPRVGGPACRLARRPGGRSLIGPEVRAAVGGPRPAA